MNQDTKVAEHPIDPRDAHATGAEGRGGLAAIVESTQNGILGLDASGRIQYASPAATRLFGWDPVELQGRHFDTLIAEPLRAQVWATIAEGVQTGRATDGPWEMLPAQRRDGSTFPARLAVFSLRWDDQVYLCAIIYDLTAERTLQLQLGRMNRLEAIGRLSGGIAHDFNNLLMGVRGCLELASRHVGPGSAALQYLQEATEAIDSGAAIAEQLAAFARPEPAEPQAIAIDEVIGGLRELLRSMLGASIHLSLDLGADAARVQTKRSKIEQILVNLVSNAAEAMPHGGSVSCATQVVWAADRGLSRPPDAYVELSVRDDGPGIPAEIRDRLFDPFVTTQPEHRTGLGLSVVRAIVESMQGEVTVDSAPGGTTIRILLPASGVRAPARRAPQQEAPRAPAPVMLLISAYGPVRDALCVGLEDDGWSVLDAGTLSGARRVLAEHLAEIEVVLADVQVPDGVTQQLAEEMADMAPELPFIFMSGVDREQLVRDGLLPRDAVFVAKPFDLDDLAQLLEGHRALH